MDSKDKNKPPSLLANWKQHINTDQEKSEDKKTKIGNQFQASGPQKRIFFLHQLYQSKSVYNLTEIWEFRGPLSQKILLNSFDKVCESQDLLRSKFEIKEGEIYYFIQEGSAYDYEFIDHRGIDKANKKSTLNKIAKQKSNIHFDLNKGPLINITLCQSENEVFFLIINIHHIISDKWSMQLLRNELSLNYKALNNNSQLTDKQLQKHQYADYVNHEQKNKAGDTTIEYWKEKLKNQVTGITFPSEKNTSINTSLAGAYLSKKLPLSLFPKIKDFCNQNKLTPFAFFLSIFKLLVHKYTQEKDITIGTPISTRSKVDFENIIGFFNDTVVLRTKLIESISFLDFMNATKETVLEAFKHKDLNFDQLIKTLNPKRVENQNPFFSLMFLFHKEFGQQVFSDHITLDIENFDMGVSKFDLTLYIGEHDDHFEITVEYATDLYSEAYVQEIIHHYFNLISQVLNQPDQKISDLELLNRSEEEELIALGKGEEFFIDQNYNLVNSIFAQANKEAIAIKDQNKQYSYHELDKKSNSVAQELLKHNPKEKRVAIIMEQSCDFIVAMIGALKAGYAYIPLDLEYPTDHIEYVIEDAKIELIINSTSSDSTNKFSQKNIIISDLKESNFKNTGFIKQEDIAYIIYTSGSTGKPKGAKISHGNLINSTLARFNFYSEHPESYLLLSSLSFDSSVAGVYWTLLHGGTLVIPNKKTFNDIEKLSEIIIENKVSHTLLIPSLYNAFLEFIPSEILSNLKLVILAGESLPLPVAEKHLKLLKHTKLYNEYGPSEATVWASAYEIKSTENLQSIPIGKAIGNSTLLILDDHLKLVPKGQAGELFISGKSVCKNYLNLEDKKNGPFIEKIILGQKIRLYKTGDWVKWNDKNELLFLERKDRQLKIRGHRIELGEIDAKIQSFDASIETVTVFHAAKKELISFIKSSKKINEKELKTYLKSKLPKHYIPNRIISLEQFPTLPNGKFNVKELENFHFEHEPKVESQANMNDFESSMIEIWRDTLKVADLGIHDNYFEAGGDSIQIIRIIARAKKLGFKISLNDIYKYQNIYELGLQISPNETKENQLILFDKLPISPIQEWFFETFKNKPGHWCLGFSFDLKENCKVDVFYNAIKKLIQRYPVLQMVFKKEYQKWFQVPSSFPIDKIIYTEVYNPETFNGFNIENGPLVRFYLKENAGMVASGHIVIHHLIIDALSWDNLFGFLNDEINNKHIGPIPPSQEYFKWIIEQNQLASTEYSNQHIEYWQKINVGQSKYLSNRKNSTEAKHKTKQIAFDKSLSKSIKSLGRKISKLTVDEMIIACFLDVYQSQTKESSVRIMLERHGRKGEHIELSDSIGWHTSFFPVHFKLSDPGNIYQTLINVKEQIRKTPNEGKSYGTLKYLSNKLSRNAEATIIINHLGDSFTQEYSQFNNLQSLTKGMRSDNSERNQLFEINSWIKNESLHISLSYNASEIKNEEIEVWVKKLEARITGLTRELKDKEKIHTPSDFKYVINQNELNKVIASTKKDNVEIENIIKLTSGQSALLFHNLQSPNNDQGLIQASAQIGGEIQSDLLQFAWNKVIEQNDVLRSFILWDGLENPLQLIGKQVNANIEFLSINQQETNSLNINNAPSHRLVCIKNSKTDYSLHFTCHHIFLDGWSTYNIHNKLLSFYTILESGDSIKKSKIIGLKEWKYEFDNKTKDLNLIQF